MFQGQQPLFRTFTYRILATLVQNLAFNKVSSPKCLHDNEAELLNKAYLQACKNMITCLTAWCEPGEQAYHTVVVRLKDEICDKFKVLVSE